MERVGVTQIGDYTSSLGEMVMLGGSGVGLGTGRGLVYDESSFYGAWFCRGRRCGNRDTPVL